MSMNFDRPIDEETKAFMKKFLGEPVAQDDKTALYNEMKVANRRDMTELANKAGQVATMELNEIGDTKTMSDGAEYILRKTGWIKK